MGFGPTGRPTIGRRADSGSDRLAVLSVWAAWREEMLTNASIRPSKGSYNMLGENDGGLWGGAYGPGS